MLEDCHSDVTPFSHLSSASLIIKFVIDASWLVPTTLSEVTSATMLTMLVTTTHLTDVDRRNIHVASFDKRRSLCQPKYMKPSSIVDSLQSVYFQLI